MDDILILKDTKGGTAVLTTMSPVSRYNLPVLRITAKDVNGDFAPDDIIGSLPNAIIAGDIVLSWAKSPVRTPAEINAAKAFLSQSPNFSGRLDSPAAQLGSLKSERKAAASRENGRKGGRPRKTSA